MYNRLLIGIVVLAVVLGGVILVTSQRKSGVSQQPPAPQTTPQTQTQGETPQAPTGNQLTQEAIVTVTPDGFSPATITVKTGTRVTWVNKGTGVVTVHSAVHPTHLVFPPLNLGEFGDGSSVQLVFDKPGTYKYHNHLNPQMTGTVVVE